MRNEKVLERIKTDTFLQ